MTREAGATSQSRTTVVAKKKSNGRRPPSKMTRQRFNDKRSQRQFTKQVVKKVAAGNLQK